METPIQIVTANHTGPLKRNQQIPRDVLIKFPDWSTENTVQNLFRGGRGVSVESSKLFCFPNLSVITLWKRKNLKFLTTVLSQHHIPVTDGDSHLN